MSIARVAVAALVVGCGGAPDEPLSSPSSETTEVGRSVAALEQYRREQPMLAAKARKSKATSSSSQRAPASCMQQLHASLSGVKAHGVRPVGCLAGEYQGKTLQQRDCSLRLDTTDAPFQFIYMAGMLVLQPDAAPAIPVTIEHRVAAFDVAPGEIMIEWRRDDRRISGNRESLVLTAAPQADGSDRLIEMTYERGHGSRVDIARCRFVD